MPNPCLPYAYPIPTPCPTPWLTLAYPLPTPCQRLAYLPGVDLGAICQLLRIRLNAT